MTRQDPVNDDEHSMRLLLQQGMAGDDAAYRAFLHGQSARLRAFFRRRLTSLPDEVEDLVQETLLAIHVHRHTYDAALPLGAWVHAIARHKLADLFRRRGTREQLTDSIDDHDELEASPATEAAAAQRDLAVLLQTLPDRQRLPIVCMKLEGLSVTETAQRTGMSESAVKVGVHRGLKALARLLGREP